MSAHRVDVVVQLDDGTTTICQWVRNWEDREAHEGFHPAQWVVKFDPDQLDELRGAFVDAYRLFTAARVLSIGPVVYAAEQETP